MTPQEVVATVQKVLSAPLKPALAIGPKEDATEKLIMAFTVVMSLKDKELLGAIFSESNNRKMIGDAVGKNPWEM